MSVPFITQLQRITDRLSLPLRYPGREDVKRHWISYWLSLDDSAQLLRCAWTEHKR
ncbi:hypothetical protein NEUTE1DRAFT_143282 [Neurospora tetrasperma FGSC 2508]|uniref:Uncharacterized protein n=1 Tax=Neurospora tetrasperma (strain FGSC 2508 / ATCC MYA-4615 / P0657) TaxID=510951 RepID=F8N468_NEUT8|nr:uncharacterized protein NEUTE1DRAFT_143282 [Neurospora tetrasperma FGSC 2508]EGO53511.1 hypothetical protein NEUTE1DRAFT_143282 [Neurospora tetrasperma FGSC 2508]